MKLDHPLTEPQRQRLERTLGTLQRAHAAFEAKLLAFSQATAERGVLETRLGTARRTARVLPAAAAKLAPLEAELGRSQEKCRAAQAEAEAARQSALDTIRDAGRLIQTVCAPLLEQFRLGLAEALRAFCVNPEGTAAAIPDHGTELPALVRFLQRGQHVSRLAGPEEIEGLTFELSQTLRAILEGGDIWRLRGETVIQDVAG